VLEAVPASRKLGRAEAAEMAAAAKRVIVARSGKVSEFSPGRAAAAAVDVVEAMLGPTGNLRAPTLRVGATVIVGYDEATYERVLG